jgi:uncharacterized membrane protein
MKNQLDRVNFLMNFDSKKTLNENRGNFLPNDDGYIFDFVITENGKYMILADNLVSTELGYIGNIWENTWVFNELIEENLKNFGDLLEEQTAKSIIWTKELFLETLQSITAQEVLDEQIWDWMKKTASSAVSGIKKVGGAIAKNVGDLAKKVLMQGVLPAMRWIRRNAYTAIGTVVDVVSAMIPVTTGINKLIWAMIVILDILEITTGNFDPQDEERRADPYSGLLIDLISFTFAAAIGLGAKAAVKAVKAGKPVSGFLKNTITKLKGVFPSIASSLKSFGDIIVKYIPGAKNIVNTVLSGVNKVLSGLDKFINQLFSKQGALAVGTGAVVAFISKPVILGIGSSGQDVAAMNKYFKEIHNLVVPDKFKVDPKKISTGNSFDKNSEDAVKKFATYFNSDPELSKYTQLRTDGKIDNPGLQAMGITMDDRGIAKLIPQKAKDAMGKAAKAGTDFLRKGLKGVEAKRPTA